MSERDIFDALREGDPAAGIDPREAARLKEQIRTKVLTEAEPEPTRPRFKRVAVIVVVAAAATAAAVFLTRQPTNPSGIGCFQAPSLDAIQFVVTPSEAIDPTECAPLWADGTITNPAIVPAGQIPALTGCVNETGTLTVFPTDDPAFCERVGMANYERPPGNDTVELNRRLVDLFLTSGCLGIDDARVRVEEILTQSGFDDWTIVVSTPTTPERPCASLAFDADNHQINLVPVPRTDANR